MKNHTAGTGKSTPLLHACHMDLMQRSLTRPFGTVQRLQGQAIEVRGPDWPIGALCHIVLRHSGRSRLRLLAEVVAARPGHVTLMAYGQLEGLAAGDEVFPLDGEDAGGIPAGEGLLGRVIDCFGQSLDGRPLPAGTNLQPLQTAPLNPLQRPVIDTVLETGVRSIDGLLTLGRGQRVGIFSGSGVGKSTLLAMIARHAGAGDDRYGKDGGKDGGNEAGTATGAVASDAAARPALNHATAPAQGADLNVIALIGERGREVRDFLERQLGVAGLARSVVVVATAEQPALARVRAAHTAVAIADHFRAQGRHVLLTMDSVTRLAMARREIGLAAGEPATARGYTPSAFSEIIRLCEACGTAASGGAITALLTVLVEGDDFNEPISDCLRAVLDGHIVLTRLLAQQSFYPAIDVLQSTSRLQRELSTPEQRLLASEALRHLALLERYRAMIDIGAYEKGSNAALDRALQLEPALHAWQRQEHGGVRRADAIRELKAIFGQNGAPS